MTEAFEKAGVIHRDISVGNIILVRDRDLPKGPRKGFLIDWELACSVDRKLKTVKRHERTVRSF